MSLDKAIQLFQKAKTLEDMSFTARGMSLSLALATDEERYQLIADTQRQAWIRPMLRIAEIDNLESLKRHLEDSTETFTKLEELGKIGTLESMELAENFAIDELKIFDMIFINRAFLCQYLRCEKVLFLETKLPWIKSLGWFRTSTACNLLANTRKKLYERVIKHAWWIWILENGREDMVDPVHFTEEQKGKP